MGSNSKLLPLITTKTTVPTPVALSGTIDSSGISVQGLGTDFLADLEEDEWIYDAAQDEVRQIKDISPSLEVLTLKEAFTLDLSGISLTKVPRSEFEEISIKNSGAAPGKVDGESLPAGDIVEWSKNSRFRGQQGFIDPKVIDGTGTTIQVSVRQ